MSVLFPSILGNLSSGFRAFAYLLLVFTPGAWVTFGFRLKGLPFWARLLTGAVLSPLVVCAEFYFIRLVGIPFGPTAFILVIVNLPAVYLIWKRRGKVASLHSGDWFVGTATVAIPVVCMFSLLIHSDARVYSWHGWIHADPAYMLARGDLVLEDPTLAGMRMSYPAWGPLVFQAVQSFVMNSPPVSSYIGSNLVWLIAAYGFAAGIAKEMGGGKLAQLGSGIWLLLGTNPAQYMTKWFWVGGPFCCDIRVIWWIAKFQISGPMALAIAMLMGMIYLLVRAGPITKESLTTICLLLSGIGLLYPLLFPPACGIIGARAIAPLVARQNGRWAIPYREWLVWAGLLLIAVLLTYSEVRFLTSERLAAASPVLFSGKRATIYKAWASLTVTSLFLAGWAFTFRSCWNSRRTMTLVLSGGALASYILYATLHIPFDENEYKFIFAVTMCLAVFPALAVERIWREWRRALAVPALAAIAFLVLGTYGLFAYQTWPALWFSDHTLKRARVPVLNTKGFYLHLDDRETWSGVCNAVLGMTPSNSILILKNDEFYYPGLTARSLYVSAANRFYPGVTMWGDSLDADVRGYGRQILAERRATLNDFFDASDAGRREQALNTILALKRPVAIIAEPQHAGLVQWLEHRETATRLYARNGLSLWLIDGTGATRR